MGFLIMSYLASSPWLLPRGVTLPFLDLYPCICQKRALDLGQEHPPMRLGESLGPGGGANGQADCVAAT